MRLRMAEPDQERYGGPEWLDFGDVPAWLDSLGYDDLVAVEKQVRAELEPSNPKQGEEKPLLRVMYLLLTNAEEALYMPMRLVRLWLSLRAAGVDVALAEFRPARMWAVRLDNTVGGSVPPPGASDSSPTSSPESDATTSSSTSESFTAASTPGPGEPTA